MRWSEFRNNCCSMSESQLELCIQELEDIGTGEDVVRSLWRFKTPEMCAQLVKKAIELGACFDHDDFENLQDELPEAAYRDLAERLGFDADNPSYNKNDTSWGHFFENFAEWPKEIQLSVINKLEKLGKRQEVVDAIFCLEEKELREILVKKAIAAGVKFKHEEFEELQYELSNDVYCELAEHTGFDADYPSYNKDKTSWSHFYENFTDWSDDIQREAIEKLKKFGKHDEVVDAILSLDGEIERVLLVRKAIAAGVKFNHEDFENLEGELPETIYRELAEYTGCSAECPDFDKSNKSWKYFYENSSCWTEEIQLLAIASLNTFGRQNQVMEAILQMDTQPPKNKLAEMAIEKKVVFSRENLMQLDGELPQELFEKLQKMAEVPEGDLYFDEANMTWDDFESSYSDWSEELIAKRVGMLKDFGDAESVCEVIMCMPSSELEDALYEKAVAKGVKFTEEQLDNMGRVNFQVQKMLDNFATEEQITQLEQDVAVICEQLDEISPERIEGEIAKAEVKNALKGLAFIPAAIFGAAYVVLGTIFGLAKEYDGDSRRTKSFWGGFGRKTSKKKSRHCDGDCANCPAHYGYRYGRWYYGHGHQWGCERGGNGGRTGRTYRD